MQTAQAGSNCKSATHWEEHPGGATLATATDVAEFGLRYRSVAGDLTIKGPGVTDTDALVCLEHIDGDLWVMDNPELVRLALPALHGLSDLWIHDNPKLETVSLPALKTITNRGADAVGGHLRIQRSASLSELSTPLLSRLDGDLELLALPNLNALLLPRIDRVGRRVLVRNTALRQLSLPRLASVGEDLGIDDVPTLKAVVLPALRRVGGDLWLGTPPDGHRDPSTKTGIRGNAALSRVAIPAVTYVGGKLTIADNPSLVQLQLPQAVKTGLGIEIRQCSRLPARELENLRETVTGSITLCGLRDSPPCR